MKSFIWEHIGANSVDGLFIAFIQCDDRLHRWLLRCEDMEAQTGQYQNLGNVSDMTYFRDLWCHVRVELFLPLSTKPHIEAHSRVFART